MTAKALKDVLERVEAWPQEDQEALAEYARAIEARRTGVYRLTDDERAAIQKARQSGLVPDEQMDAYWKRHGIT
jgi:hypothetical protein